MVGGGSHHVTIRTAECIYLNDTFNKSLWEALNKLDNDSKKLAENFAQSLKPPSPPALGLVPEIRNKARDLIECVTEEINEWRKTLPENKTFVIGMGIPDGRYMIARKLGPLSDNGFVAHGWVDGVDCMVTGHISTLIILCAEMGKSTEVGFTAKVPNASVRP
jgi:hypothetical protein